MKRGRPPIPSTNQDPLLRQLFNEQDRLQVSTSRLAKISGIRAEIIAHYRHPSVFHGKRPHYEHVKALALALDFKWPEKLTKNGDHL